MQRAPSLVAIVDDEESVRRALGRLVRSAGFHVQTFASGADFLHSLSGSTPQCVVLDLRMPHMSGAEVIAALRLRRPGLPVVVCSGYDRDGRGPVQADAYLPKPFRIDHLERTLAKLLPLRSV